MKASFESDIDIKLQLKSPYALSFIPTNEVKDVFHELVVTFSNEVPYHEVITYFLSIYIEGTTGKDSLFSIRIWNYHESAIDQSDRTTNCCDGFHKTLNSLFPFMVNV